MASKPDTGPTIEGWRMALLLLAFATATLFLEKGLELLQRAVASQRGLAVALQHIKNELLFVGSISLLLSAFQDLLAQICIPLSKPSVYVDQRRHLLGGGSATYCDPDGQSLWPVALQHDTHIFIFVVACTHVVYGTITVYLTIWRVKSWRKWEQAAQEQVRASHGDLRVMKMPHKFLYRNVGSNPVIHFFLMLVRQYQMSVNPSLYSNARLLFIEKMGLDYDFHFHEVVIKGLETELMTTLHPEWHLWLIAVVWYAVPPPAYVSFWMYGTALLIIVLVGGKLVDILVQLSVQVAIKYGDSVVFGRMDSNPRAPRALGTLGRASLPRSSAVVDPTIQQRFLDGFNGLLGVWGAAVAAASGVAAIGGTRSDGGTGGGGGAAAAAAADSAAAADGGGSPPRGGPMALHRLSREKELVLRALRSMTRPNVCLGGCGEGLQAEHRERQPPQQQQQQPQQAVGPQPSAAALTPGAASQHEPAASSTSVAAAADASPRRLSLARGSAPAAVRRPNSLRLYFLEGGVCGEDGGSAAAARIGAAGGGGGSGGWVFPEVGPSGVRRNLGVALDKESVRQLSMKRNGSRLATQRSHDPGSNHHHHHHHRRHRRTSGSHHHHNHQCTQHQQRRSRHPLASGGGSGGGGSSGGSPARQPGRPGSGGGCGEGGSPNGDAGSSREMPRSPRSGAGRSKSIFELFQRSPQQVARVASLRRALGAISEVGSPGSGPASSKHQPTSQRYERAGERTMSGGGGFAAAAHPAAQVTTTAAGSLGRRPSRRRDPSTRVSGPGLAGMREEGEGGDDGGAPSSCGGSRSYSSGGSSSSNGSSSGGGGSAGVDCGGGGRRRRRRWVLRVRRTSSGRRQVPLLMRPFYCGAKYLDRPDKYVKDMLTRREARGVHRLDAREFFWFRKPRFMTALFTLAYFQNSLSIAICIFSLAGLQTDISVWDSVPKWAVALQLCLDLLLVPLVSLSVLPYYALIQPLGSHCPQGLLELARLDRKPLRQQSPTRRKYSAFTDLSVHWRAGSKSHGSGDSGGGGGSSTTVTGSSNRGRLTGLLLHSGGRCKAGSRPGPPEANLPAGTDTAIPFSTTSAAATAGSGPSAPRAAARSGPQSKAVSFSPRFRSSAEISRQELPRTPRMSSETEGPRNGHLCVEGSGRGLGVAAVQRSSMSLRRGGKEPQPQPLPVPLLVHQSDGRSPRAKTNGAGGGAAVVAAEAERSAAASSGEQQEAPGMYVQIVVDGPSPVRRPVAGGRC